MVRIILAIVCAFVLGLILGKVYIPMLHALKAGQSIREIGPKWHEVKAGTPTIGGIIFISAMVVSIFAGIANPEGDYTHLLVLAFALLPVMKKSDENPRVLDRLLVLMLAIGVLYWAFVIFYRFPADVDPDNLYEGTKNAYTLLGCLAGLLIARAIDERHTRFDVKAVWWAQILKVVLGLGLVVAIKAGLKAPLQAVLSVYPAYAVRYGLMVLFAGAVWPLTFPWFARLGRR